MNFIARSLRGIVLALACALPSAWLLATGAAVNPRDGEGRTPRHMAAFAARAENGKLLLQAGADPALKTDAGRDVLSMARKVPGTIIAQECFEAWACHANNVLPVQFGLP